ncbi:roadblock/LC7 domain-containing protein [Geomonas sp. RF6]|uniref:roadblock/LC7 domain-containing protein n=1 Tax=Geomonas sp. RF6 TaxID=2897342 RepID=UPI001E40D2BB|nr:roadblock/LC7 domain-containing protein [Geomonas sp. RF6]UFS68761.1 roadblock/LC7 domain-containing protein [Geomonas sp. RF6]
MPFKLLLTELVEGVPGASGAILADWEGEAVEQHTLLDPYEMKVTAAHWGIILSSMKGMGKKLPMGDVGEGIITTDAQHVLVGAVGEDYTLVMTLSRSTLPLMALRSFRCTVERLKKEIY